MTKNVASSDERHIFYIKVVISELVCNMNCYFLHN